MAFLRELTVADLIQTPVWRHEGGDDETSVVFPAREFEDVDHQGYIALTQFIFADGTIQFGFCSPQDPSGMDYVQLVIICDNDHIRLWQDNALPEAVQNELLERLGKSRAEVFPIRCECQIPFEGIRFVAAIRNFNSMDL